MRGDWILSTQRLPIHWSLRDSRGDDIAFVSSQMQAKFRRRFRVVFSWARIDRDANLNKIFEAWKTFFPKDSYLGVLRLFLRVLEVARSRRLGRAREILAFLGKKVGKLYFWEEVVSTFPLALFDHFQKFTCAEEASRRNRFWNQMWSQKGDSDAITIA